MIAASCFKDKNIALFGLGGSGQITAASLIAGGANVIAWDDNPEQCILAEKNGVPTSNLRELDWSKFDAFVLAPGVPLTHPQPHWSVELAKAADVEIIGDVEIFARERALIAPNSPFIAITGTNGKSTTTALISHILNACGLDVQMGGNIGTAILSLDALSDEKYYVIECSSYQIDLAPSLNASVGILLNLTTDHLDRHGSMAHYASVKERLVTKSDFAIVGVDDEWCRKISENRTAYDRPIMPISSTEILADGIFARGELLIQSDGGKVEEIANLGEITTLQGAHNGQNAAAAFAACGALGLKNRNIAQALKTFFGLSHRMQPVVASGDILFVNDSKATNAQATAPALQSFDNIFWIAGGLSKDGGISSLRSLLGQIQKSYLIGEAAPEFAAQLSGLVAFEISNTLDVAIERAFGDAQSFVEAHGEKAVILFSPACASFDQFRNFEIRGQAFVDRVSSLSGVDMLIAIDERDK